MAGISNKPPRVPRVLFLSTRGTRLSIKAINDLNGRTSGSMPLVRPKPNFRMIDKEIYRYRDQYSAWLMSLPWDYFFTGTFGLNYYDNLKEDDTEEVQRYKKRNNWGDITPNGARRVCERFFTKYKSRELIVLFIEFGAMYGKVHVHGLLRFNPVEKPTASLIWEHWFSKYGRATVEEIKSRENVSNYCTKYITKDLKDESLIVIT